MLKSQREVVISSAIIVMFNRRNVQQFLTQGITDRFYCEILKIKTKPNFLTHHIFSDIPITIINITNAKFITAWTYWQEDNE